MLLTDENLLFYLIERGLLSAETAVKGNLSIIESSSRNRNFKVVCPDQSGLFVKQAKPGEQEAISFLQREATTYYFAQNDKHFNSLKALIPRYRSFDARQHVLVIDLAAGENLFEHHRRTQRFPVEIGGKLGTTLAAYHGDIRPNGQSAAFPQTLPWILSAHRLQHLPTNAQGNANGQVLSIIQQFADFHPILDDLRHQWQTDTFIHGDMKWENCLLTQREGEMELKIIDWETADVGDPAWDIGAIFQAYLTCWIMSIPPSSNPAALAIEQATFPIEAMLPAIAAFWQRYREKRQLAEAAASDLLRRSVQLGAARMLQTAYEYMFYAQQITGNALAQLQVSMNVLKEPQVAIVDLLGLGAHV